MLTLYQTTFGYTNIKNNDFPHSLCHSSIGPLPSCYCEQYLDLEVFYRKWTQSSGSFLKFLGTITRSHGIVVAATVLNAALAIFATTAVLPALYYENKNDYGYAFLLIAIAVEIFACVSLNGFFYFYQRLDKSISLSQYLSTHGCGIDA